LVGISNMVARAMRGMRPRLKQKARKLQAKRRRSTV
jgi:hypothetical protein